MRLIDADALEYKRIQTADNKGYIVVHAGEIDSAPTAYNLEKVIKELKELRDFKANNFNISKYGLMQMVIEVVQSGGVGAVD